ncbi:MAG: glycosyltransferase family 4 protein [Actinomycetes bacterium]
MTPRVLLVVGHSTGGIGGHVASLARGLPSQGWTPVVATSPVTAARFDFGDADVVRSWPAGSDTPGALRRLRSLVTSADVVHAHGHQAGLLAVLVAGSVRPRPPVVVSWHNAVLGAGAGRRARAVLEAVQARRADLLTGASDDLVERARDLGAARARLAPVAAPDAGGWAGDRAAERAALARELGLDPGGPWLLTVSRVAPQKNLPVLVDAAARLRERPGLAWLVVGEGDAGLQARLDEQARATGAPVRFLGARRDVTRLMALADAFVLASDWEARALVVQEALAAGTPVVTTAVGGLPELVGDAGVLVPPGDAAALADAVGRLLDDPAERERLGRAGVERFAQLPTEPEVVSQWAAEYRRLLAW